MNLALGPTDQEFWDPAWFFPRNFQVLPRVGGRPIPFDLLPVQKVLAAFVVRCYKERKWLAHVKPRKEGASTFFTAVLTQHAMFKYGCHALIVGQRHDVTRDLARTAVRFYRTMNPAIRPARNTKLKVTLEFPDHDGILDCATVRQDDPGRGFTGIHSLLATEICKWGDKAGPDAWTSLLSNIPDPDPTAEDGAFVVAESTPMHHKDEIHKLWERSKEPNSPWIRCFVPWTMILEYQAEPPVGWLPSEEVAVYAHDHSLTERQTFWMQSVGLPKCAGHIERFRAEYPISEIDCWALAGEKVFSPARIRSILKELDHGTHVTEETTDYVEWEGPEHGHRYVVFCDPAGSWAKKDRFAIEVLDMTTCTQVAEYLGHMDAWACARKLAEVGARYNKANVYVESNGVGEAVLLPLVRIYPRTYHRRSGTGPTAERKPGWSNNKKTKVEAVGITQELLEDGSVTIRSHRLLGQMGDYRGQWDKLKREKDTGGGHFDLVAAFCGACWAYAKEMGGRRVVPAKETAEERVDRAWKKLTRDWDTQRGGFKTPWGHMR